MSSTNWALVGLSEVQAELEGAEATRQDLRLRINMVEQRLDHLRVLARELEAHVRREADAERVNEHQPEPEPEPARALAPLSEVMARGGRVDQPAMEVHPHGRQIADLPRPTIKRIRSTKIVSDLVRELARQVTRDEVVDEFLARGLAPAEWQDPRNAIGNALNRAAADGQIDRFDRDTFAPAGWTPATQTQRDRETISG